MTNLLRSIPSILWNAVMAPVVLVYRLASAWLLLSVFSATSDPEKPMPRPTTVESAHRFSERIRRGAPTLHASPTVAYGHLASGVAWGLAIYLVVVHHAFDHLQSVLTDGGSPKELQVFEDRGPTKNKEEAALVLHATSEEIPGSVKLKAADDAQDYQPYLVGALQDGRKQEGHGFRYPSLPIAVRLALGDSQCSDQATECDRRLRVSVERLLIGYSPKWTEYDKQFLAYALARHAGQATAPEEPSLTDRFIEAATFRRSTPLDPGEVAALLTRSSDSDDEVRRLLVQHFLQAAINHDDARRVLTYEVGIFFGWERLVVLVLLLSIASALVYRQYARVPVEEQAMYVHRELRELARQWAGGGPADAAARTQAVQGLCERFDARFPGLRDTNYGRPDERQRASSADPQLHPVAGLLSAILRATRSGNDQLIAVAEEDASEHMGRWRETVNSFITLFPVIGFSATLLGLIAAFSAADRVALFTGIQKAAAVRAMVSDLSTCFATTFLALLCMALLTLFSLRQGQREQSLIARLGSELRAAFGGR